MAALAESCHCAQVRQPETVKVANYLIERLSKATVTAELLHPDELVSGMISQVAASPELADLLSGFIYSHQGMLPRLLHVLKRPIAHVQPKNLSFARQ